MEDDSAVAMDDKQFEEALPPSLRSGGLSAVSSRRPSYVSEFSSRPKLGSQQSFERTPMDFLGWQNQNGNAPAVPPNVPNVGTPVTAHTDAFAEPLTSTSSYPFVAKPAFDVDRWLDEKGEGEQRPRADSKTGLFPQGWNIWAHGDKDAASGKGHAHTNSSDLAPIGTGSPQSVHPVLSRTKFQRSLSVSMPRDDDADVLAEQVQRMNLQQRQQFDRPFGKVWHDQPNSPQQPQKGALPPHMQQQPESRRHSYAAPGVQTVSAGVPHNLSQSDAQDNSALLTHIQQAESGRDVESYFDDKPRDKDLAQELLQKELEQRERDHVKDAMPSRKLYLVRFKGGRTDVFFVPEASNLVVKTGDLVIVDADRGRDLGKVTRDNVTSEEAHQMKLKQQQEQMAVLQQTTEPDANSLPANSSLVVPKQILRFAQANEIQQLQSKKMDEDKALKLCNLKVSERGLNMKILNAEYQWDRRKLTFFYYSDSRIDFRDLVRELFRVYKTRIWMCAVNPNSTTSFSPGISEVAIHTDDKQPKQTQEGQQTQQQQPQQQHSQQHQHQQHQSKTPVQHQQPQGQSPHVNHQGGFQGSPSRQLNGHAHGGAPHGTHPQPGQHGHPQPGQAPFSYQGPPGGPWDYQYMYEQRPSYLVNGMYTQGYPNYNYGGFQ
ncbi:hypothetical protein CJU90_4978 [Yarrowia sp. C11]|nr:hypothetical protein CJU90_4978 [Yarrowia sp. C11]